MLWAFEAGGIMMFVILATALATMLLVLIAAGLVFHARRTHKLILRAKIFSVVVLLSTALPGLAGVAGWMLAKSAVESALPDAEPSFPEEAREAMRAAGMAEAAYPLNFGAGSTLCVGGAAAVVAFLGLTTPKPISLEDI